MPLETSPILRPSDFPGTHSQQLQAMSDMAADYPLQGRVLDWSGEWEVSTPWHIRKAPPGVEVSRTRHRCGQLKVVGTGLSEVLRIDAPRCTFEGPIYIKGEGGSTLASRSTRDLVVLGDVVGTKFGGWDLSQALGWGIRPDGGNQVHCDLGHVEGWDLGSSAGLGPDYARAIAFKARVDFESINHPNQRSTLELDDEEVWPQLLEISSLVFLNGFPHVVTGLDEAGRKVSIYPRIIDPSVTSGVLVSSHGGAVASVGGNTSGMGGSIHTLRCGEALWSGSYGGSWRSVVTDGGGSGVRLGAIPGGFHIGGHIGHLHLEGLSSHVVKVCRGDVDPFTIGSTVGLDLGKCWGLSPSGPAGPSNQRWRQLRGVVFSNYQGAPLGQAGPMLAHGAIPGTLEVTPRPGPMEPVMIPGSAPSVALVWDEPASELYGPVQAWIVVVGAPGEAPTELTLTSTTADGTIGDPELADYTRTIPLEGPGMVHVYREGGTWRASLLPFHRAA